MDRAAAIAGAPEHRSDRPLSVRLVGTPHLRLADGTARPLERKDAALLALLAFDGPTDRARAARFLYPDLPTPEARNQLRTRLFRLRRRADRDVVTTGGTLRLLHDVTVDVDALDDLLARDAQGLAGDLLGDLDYSEVDTIDAWLFAARATWAARRNDRIAAIASDLEQRGEIVAALRYAARLVVEAPAMEHAHRRLMRLHYLRGDRAAGLEAYRQCVAFLERELGVAPDVETRELAALIESAESRIGGVRPKPLALVHPPRLVGRDDCTRWLAAALVERRTVVVRGDPGLGKSRLLSDFVQATPGAVLASTRLGDARFGYSSAARLVGALAARFGAPATPWVAAELSRIAPALATPPLGTLKPARLMQALQAAIAQWAADGLSMICLDDVHHADEASVELLKPVVAHCSGNGPAWALGTRPAEASSSVSVWIDAAVDSHAEVRDLEPLDVAAIDELMGSLALPGLQATPWAIALKKRTGGNPFFILETLLATVDRGNALPATPPDQLPQSLRVGSLIDRRLASLDPAARDLARIAAIAGEDFDARLAATVLDRGLMDIASAWQALEAAAVFVDGRFVHDLVLEAVIRSVPEAIGEALHRQVATSLDGRVVPARRIALHWQAAREWKSAGDAFAAAARAAQSTSRPVEELALWESSVAAYERAGLDDAAFEVACESMGALRNARPLQENLERTRLLCDSARSDAQRLAASIPRAVALSLAGAWSDALRCSEEAARLAAALQADWSAFDAARVKATTLAMLGETERAASTLSRFETQVRTSGSVRHRLDYLSDLGYTLWAGERHAAAAECYAEAVALARSVGDLAEALTCLSNLASMYGALGRRLESARSSRDACDLIEATGGLGLTAAIAFINAGTEHLYIGDFAAALSLLDRGIERLDQPGCEGYLPVGHNHIATAWMRLGQFARARQALQPIDPDRPATLKARVRRVTVEAQWERLANGKRIVIVLPASIPAGDARLSIEARLEECRLLEPDAAVAACRALDEEATARNFVPVVMTARLIGIEALVRAGRSAEAASMAKKTWPSLTPCGPADLYWPEALMILVDALFGNGTRAADRLAATILAEAHAWVRDVALPCVPAAYRDTFLTRNDANRRVIDEGRRRLGLGLEGPG